MRYLPALALPFAALCASSGAHVADKDDLVRAATRRPLASSPVAADSHAGVFHAIDRHLRAAGVPVRACEDHSHSDLTRIIDQFDSRRDGQLQRLYESRMDRRAVRFTAGGENKTAAIRDALCAHAVMMWAHHLPAAARKELSEDATFALPLMPAAGPQSDGGSLYKALVSCVGCHYIGGKDEAVSAAPQAAGEPPLPMWGGAKQFRVEVNMTDVSDAPDHPNWRFTYFYDATLKADRYEHAKDQHDEVCGKSTFNTPCNVINSGDETRYLLFGGKCCAQSGWFPGSGAVAVRSDWVQNGGASYVGPTTVRGIAVDEWLKQGASDNHYYATADAKQLPVRYMEHKNGKLKQWDFDLTTYTATSQPKTLFVKPDGCTTRCAGEEEKNVLV